MAQVGAGLEAAHAAGLVHRDVKPANVLLAGDEGALHVYLTDFGLTLDASSDTRLTQTGDVLGTVEYMAPEQLEAEPVSARTDVYALGCVLYAALTGRPPFSRGTYAATMLAHLGDPPPRPSATEGVPAAFDAVVARALAKRPEDRYPSARELVEAALAAAGHAGGRDEPPWRPARRPETAIRARSRRRCRPRRSGCLQIERRLRCRRIEAARPAGPRPPRPGSAVRQGPTRRGDWPRRPRPWPSPRRSPCCWRSTPARSAPARSPAR